MDRAERFVYLNGKIVPEDQALISPFDRGFLWGDGVYEVTPCFNGQPFRLEDHFDRLAKSLRYTQIDPPASTAELHAVTERVLEANSDVLSEHQTCKLGHWVTRGPDTVGMMAKDAGPSTLLIFCWPVTPDESRAEHYKQGVRVTIVPTRRNPPGAVEPRAKVTSKMNQILAELDGYANNGVPLMLDMDGHVAEGNIANFFIVLNGTILTSPGRTVLEGITRKTVIEYANLLDIPVHERAFTTYEIAQADEFFLSQSTYCVLPVREVDRFQPTEAVPGAITSKLMGRFTLETGINFLSGPG